jgi:hypothetical protein
MIHMAAPRTRKKKEDVMDGAQYPHSGATSATPADYMDDPVTGTRKHNSVPPSGHMKTDLEYETSLRYAVLPPRSIWKKGTWMGNSGNEYRTWVVDGQGTPGNYEERRYLLPYRVAEEPLPPHPADWKKGVWEKNPSTGDTKTPTTKAAALPFGIRFRDPKCGHWFRETDLVAHAKVCPGLQDGESDWAIECECCTSLDDTAKCKPGFPRPKPKPAAKTTKPAA